MKLLSESDENIEFEGVSPDRFSFSLQGKERLVFYTKLQKAVIFSYNFKLRKIEFVHLNSSDLPLISLIPSNITPNEKTQNYLIVNRDSNQILTFNTLKKEKNVRDLIYSQEQEEIEQDALLINYLKCQYCSLDENSAKKEFIIFYKNQGFYYFDFELLAPVKFLPNDKFSVGKVESWYVYKDLLVVLNQDNFLHFYQICWDDLGIDDKTSQTIFFEDKAVFKINLFLEEFLIHAHVMKNKISQPIIYFNDNYLILLSFAFNSNSVIYLVSLPETFMKKVECVSSSWNLRQQVWYLQGSVSNQNLLLAIRKERQVGDYEDFVKFQDNMLFLCLDRFNLFFDFQSDLNLKANLLNIKSGNNFEVLGIKIPEEEVLKNKIKKTVVQETKKKKNESVFEELVPNKNYDKAHFIVQKGYKDILEKKAKYWHPGCYDSEDEEDWEIKDERERRRNVLRNIKRKLYHNDKYQDFVKITFRLHSLKSFYQKEWLSRLIEKRKTRKKMTFSRDREIF